MAESPRGQCVEPVAAASAQLPVLRGGKTKSPPAIATNNSWYIAKEREDKTHYIYIYIYTDIDIHIRT